MQIRFGQVCELSIDFIRSVFHWLFLRGKVRSDTRLAQHKNCVYWVNMGMKARIWEMTEACRLEVMFLDLCHSFPSNLYMFFGWTYPFLRFYVPQKCYRFLDFYFCLNFSPESVFDFFLKSTSYSTCQNGILHSNLPFPMLVNGIPSTYSVAQVRDLFPFHILVSVRTRFYSKL